MRLKNKKILFLYTGGHSVHLDFAKAIGADIRKLSKRIPKDYDIYISEGDYKILPMLKLKRKIPRNKKIINLFSDPRLFYINKKIKFKGNKIKKRNSLESKASKFLIGKFDGFITVGNFQKDLLKKICSKKPILVTPPFVSQERFKKLSKINPKLENKKILFIGNGPNWHYKGIDLLLEVFKELNDKNKQYSLDIIGNWKKPKKNIKGVNFLGEKKNISKYFNNCSLYLHLARGEAYGVTILEAMLSGIPVIIAKDIGAREIVKKVDSSMIVPYKKGKIIKKIEEYFNKNKKEKKKIGSSLKEEVKNLRKSKILKDFVLEWNSLLNKMYEYG
jgi:glycosyltransferase involved in cell wall biosynthesis